MLCLIIIYKNMYSRNFKLIKYTIEFRTADKFNAFISSIKIILMTKNVRLLKNVCKISYLIIF